MKDIHLGTRPARAAAAILFAFMCSGALLAADQSLVWTAGENPASLGAREIACSTSFITLGSSMSGSASG